jgi:hydroxymethylglutaryl-CoA lyase
VTLIEVGPRDGFQFEKKIIPTELKAEIISRLVDAGLKHIQVASFVNPARLPQMADAEDVVGRLPVFPGTIFSGLALNTKGVLRAHRAGLKHLEISISASDTHSRKNAGLSFDQAVIQMKEMIRLAREKSLGVRAGIQCAFGCVYEGAVSRERILQLVRYYSSKGVDAIALSDTTGMANPLSVKQMLQTLIPECRGIPVVLHAALECGVTQFDTAMAGMGGCPFVRGAAGNIATEDTVNLLGSMRIFTGIDIAGVSECSYRLEKYLNKRFPGKLHHLLQQEGLRY